MQASSSSSATTTEISHTASWYAASINQPSSYPTLNDNITTDVCIVGGGFTGINTAIELAAKGYRVVVLEANKIGWGASGRNGGQLIRGIGHNPQQFIKEIGSEGVDAVQRMGFESVQLVTERIQQYQIPCDLTMGYVDAALNSKQLNALAKEQEALQQLGYPTELTLLNINNISNYVNSECYVGGMHDSGSGHLHPLNLCLGEAAVAQQLGVQIFENSAVSNIWYSDYPRVKTAQGSVRCEFLVLAGNAYLNDLIKPIAGKVLPAGSYMIATEPLSEELHQQLLPQNSAVCDTGVVLDYFRLSADKRLLFGGMCNYSGRHPRSIAAALQPKMVRVFPELAQTKIEYEWGGMIGISANRFPQIGRIANNVYYAQGYSGHGVNTSHLAAHVLGQMISGQAELFDVFAKVTHHRFPGGKHLRSPLLALGMLWHRLKALF